ncbi:MAG: metalloregulator ArsR/SmtB family transcription factor [Gammaproteobacteria bacterium]|nr:metalloregulator ArsR/SmtB family transcription factor [Gammaproteobacteria bacterium]
MKTFAVLAEPTRRLLLDSLLEGAQSVNSLVDRIGMSQPVVSKHLRILRDAGLVLVKPDGQRRLYSVSPAPLAELEAWLEPYRKLWNERLNSLEEHLDEME